MARTYVTVSPDLVEYADAAADYLLEEGYKVSVEPRGLYFPNTPTMLGKKGSTEFVVEVVINAASFNCLDWVHYARARSKETFIAVVLPEATNISTDDLSRLRSHGVGVCRANAGQVDVLLQYVDVSTTIGLPDLSKEKKQLRRVLKPCFKKIMEGSVVDGFKDACGAFEDLARGHFKAGVASTRIKLVTKDGKSRQVTPAQVDRFTLGQLGVAFSEIVAPTQADDLARRAIESILKDRNDATHKASNQTVLRRVKRNTPKHTFAILNAMRELC